MHHRFFASIGTLAVVIAVVLLVTIPVAGQAPSSTAKAAPAAKKWTPARTPDGQPDLQGYWTNSTYTPLQRPNNVTKEFYSKEEAAQIEKQAAERESEQTEPGTIADVHYDFTQFGLDRNQSTHASTVRTSMIVDPSDGKLPPVTADGQKRQADRAAERRRMGATTDDVRNMPVGTRCIIMAGSGPPMMPTAYNSNYQIVQAPGYVMILTEMIHDVRIIPLDSRPQLPQNVRQWIGSSRGRWEGDTLVVETANFNGKNPFQNSSEDMRVTERFTRLDADTIDYKFTVEDEKTWARPWTASLSLRKAVGPIFEHACHEGNYGVANTLAGARAEDKRAAEAAAKKGSK
ncbi:MAG: hypothetical protein DMG12_00780 [Acidobacteria bacterium]|nr:MAG: hypothetical protein DMG12_00780 [Acidobacteriota bacterium]